MKRKKNTGVDFDVDWCVFFNAGSAATGSRLASEVSAFFASSTAGSASAAGCSFEAFVSSGFFSSLLNLLN